MSRPKSSPKLGNSSKNQRVASAKKSPLGASLEHAQALQIILASEYAMPTIASEYLPELRAIVSHWLQSPYGTTPFTDSTHHEKWRALIGNYSLLQNNPSSELPERKKNRNHTIIDFSGS